MLNTFFKMFCCELTIIAGRALDIILETNTAFSEGHSFFYNQVQLAVECEIDSNSQQCGFNLKSS